MSKFPSLPTIFRRTSPRVLAAACPPRILRAFVVLHRFDHHYNLYVSLQINVIAYSGYRANERPLYFSVDEETFEITEVEDRWYEPNVEYFKVRTTDGKRFILRYSERDDSWTLESGFDGAALFARASITLVTVDAKAIREAEQRIAGCERCRGDEAELLFDSILADVLGKHGPYEFVMTEPARCPNCRAELTEQSPVEPHGGIDVGSSSTNPTPP